jgi:uncharacterized protein (DUF4415 family)
MDMSDKSLGARQREHHHYMVDALRRFEWDMHQRIWLDQRIPVEWHDIATRRERDKIRLTLRVDADVVKWFRSMGPGYQPRMNDVLRAFMHAKLAGLLRGEETIEPFKENWQARQRMPDWGDTAKERRGKRGG